MFFRFDSTEITIDKCKEFIDNASNDDNTKHFAAVNDKDEYMGTISLKNIDFSKKEAEYAICMRSCAHGTGAATQATEQILHYAFNKLELKRVFLNVLTNNRRANSFYCKVGFRLTSVQNKAILIKGEWNDLNWYEIIHNNTEQ